MVFHEEVTVNRMILIMEIQVMEIQTMVPVRIMDQKDTAQMMDLADSLVLLDINK